MGKNQKIKAWVKDGRAEETIGGGFIVFRRGDDTNRIRPAFWPFEHATLEAAHEQAKRLAAANPGKTFDVFKSVASITIPQEIQAVEEPKGDVVPA